MRKHIIIHPFICLLFLSGLFSSCRKMLEIAPPITSITTEEMFADNIQAERAIAGIYSKMVNGSNPAAVRQITDKDFASGLSTIMAALSADELQTGSTALTPDLYCSQNKLTLTNNTKNTGIWNSAYKIIYDACAVIEGVESSKSDALQDSVRKQLTGEALALRAFSYFYLVNFFGDLPIVLTADFKKTINLTRSPVSKVYEQIKADLVKAGSLLGTDFRVGNQEKIRVNKWFTEAMLARVYLYTGEYQNAINSATNVINQTGLFGIEPNLSDVFMKNSREAIFQLKHAIEDPYLKQGTPEGLKLLWVPSVPGVAPTYILNEELVNSFETGDKRKTAWTAFHSPYYTPAKYKNGGSNEYYMVMRLAELYLIRAEAAILLSPGNTNAARTDLNILRQRAGVELLSDDLNATEIIAAIAHERRVEFFVEWGHRWFDLKRTGKAHDVLSVISYKQPWWGDYQFLYAVPPDEIRRNGQLTQNPEYDNL